MSDSDKKATASPEVSDEQSAAPELASLTPEQEEKVKGGLGSTLRGPNTGVQAN